MSQKQSRRSRVSVLILSLTVTAAAGAALPPKETPRQSYQVEAQVFVDGKVVSSPSLIVLQGEPASIEVSENAQPPTKLKLRVLANDHSDSRTGNAIHLKMVVDLKVATQSVHAKSSMILLSGESGSVALGSKLGKSEIRLSATRL